MHGEPAHDLVPLVSPLHGRAPWVHALPPGDPGPALLRPGRFDCLQYIGISSSAENKVNVLRALTRKFLLDESVCLRTLAERCPETYSGADLYALCTEAWMLAAKRVIESGDGGRSGSDGCNRKVLVAMGDFVRALQKVAPSLSRDDLVKYQALQQKYASPPR